MERDVNVQDAFKLEGQNISGFLDKTYEAAVCVNRLVSVDQQPQCLILVRKNVSHDVQWTRSAGLAIHQPANLLEAPPLSLQSPSTQNE